MLDSELHKLLAAYDAAPVECDGFTRLAHTALTNAGVQHSCMLGRLVSADGQRRTPVHLWIELPDGRLIDYRARIWLGDADSVPHGIFDRAGYSEWTYSGEIIDLPILHPVLANILMQSIPLNHLRGGQAVG